MSALLSEMLAPTWRGLALQLLAMFLVFNVAFFFGCLWRDHTVQRAAQHRALEADNARARGFYPDGAQRWPRNRRRAFARGFAGAMSRRRP